MTASRKTAKNLREICVEKGINITSKRRIILDVIESAKGHPDASVVYRLAKEKDSSIGIATVYRTLKLMRKHHILDGPTFGHEHGHFESPTKKHHDHLVCTSCGKIVEFHNRPLERIKAHEAKKHGFEMHSHKLEIFGLCPACSNNR